MLIMLVALGIMGSWLGHRAYVQNTQRRQPPNYLNPGDHRDDVNLVTVGARQVPTATEYPITMPPGVAPDANAESPAQPTADSPPPYEEDDEAPENEWPSGEPLRQESA